MSHKCSFLHLHVFFCNYFFEWLEAIPTELFVCLMWYITRKNDGSTNNDKNIFMDI